MFNLASFKLADCDNYYEFCGKIGAMIPFARKRPAGEACNIQSCSGCCVGETQFM
jgi:hypothetical protein